MFKEVVMTAEPTYTPDRFERAIAAIHELIGEHGVGHHALFGEVNEGTMLPDGTETMSGHVVDGQGRVYAFWTGWDSERCRTVFETWREVIPTGRMLTDREYLKARHEVGLDRPAQRLGQRP